MRVLTLPSTETAERISLPLILLEKINQFPLGAKLGESSLGPPLKIVSSFDFKFIVAMTKSPSNNVTYAKNSPLGPATGLALNFLLKVTLCGKPLPFARILYI